MYKTDPVWYSLVCALLYVAITPLMLVLFFTLTVVAVCGAREWAYRRLDDVMHILP